MSRRSIVVAVILSTACLARARADGGTILDSRVASGYRVTLFAEPSPLRAGPADLSVLLQEAGTDRAVLDADVSFEIRSLDEPEAAISARADHRSASNKLYYAAAVSFPRPGTWAIRVLIDGSCGKAETATRARVNPPPPRWRQYQGWIFWPFPIIAIYALRRLAWNRYSKYDFM